MEEGMKSTISQHTAKFRASPPCPKEERRSGKAFWWSNPGASDGDSTAALNNSRPAGQLPRTKSEGAEHLENTPGALKVKKGRFTIQHEPGSPQASSPHCPASSGIAGTAVTVNATAAAMPSLDALQHLIARNPALLKALTELERDESGRISSNTLERIRSALDTQAGAQSQPQQAQQRSAADVWQSPSPSASSSSSTCPRGAAAGTCEVPRNSMATNPAAAAGSNKFQGLPAGELTHRLVAHQTAMAEQAAARAAALVRSSVTQSVAGSSVADTTAAASSSTTTAVPSGVAACHHSSPDQVHVNDGAKEDASTAAAAAPAGAEALGAGCGSPHPLSATAATCSSTAVGSAGGACRGLSSPNHADSENAVSGVSSSLSSRRASLRLSLSIYVSQHEESSISSSAESHRTSSDDADSNEPAWDNAADTQLQQQQQETACCQSASSSSHSNPWQAEQATGAQQGGDSEDDAKDNAAYGLDHSSAESGAHVTTAAHDSGKKHHKPATPGFALTGEEEQHRPQDHHGKLKQQQRWHGEYEEPLFGSEQQQQQQQQHSTQPWHHKLSKRPPTPGVSLGKPVSIFNSDGRSTSTTSSSSAAPMPAGSGKKESMQHYLNAGMEGLQKQHHKQDCELEEELAAAEKIHSAKQHWHHKLSKRPLTPGVSLSKPISIFSGSGDSSPEKLQPGNKSSRSPPAHNPGCNEGVSAGESDSTADHAVQLEAPGNKASIGRLLQQQVQQGWNGCKSQEKLHQWGHKLSKRPPTPGAGLGQPTSIFTDPAGPAVAARHAGSYPSSSAGSSSNKLSGGNFAAYSCSEDADDAGSQPAVGAQHSKQRLVAFKQYLEKQLQNSQAKYEVHEGEAVSSRLVHFQEEPESAATAVSKKHPQHSKRLAKKAPRTLAEQLQQQPQQQWQHKPSKRLPTPGAGLGEPVSIFKDDSSNNSHSGGTAAKSASALDAYAVSATTATVKPKPAYDHQINSIEDDADNEAAHVRFKELKPRVVFKQELLHFSDSPISFQQACGNHQPAGGQQQQQQQQPKSKQRKQQWGSKLSKRPPTPGVGLRQPVSIFTQGAALGGRLCESEGMQHCSGSDAGSGGKGESAAGAASAVDSQHHVMQCGVLDASADSAVVCAGAMASATTATAGDASKKHIKAQTEEEEFEQGLQQPTKQPWNHKLSKRPATPGVSLGKPASIFSSNGSSSQLDASAEPASCCATAAMPAATGPLSKSVAAVLCSHNADLAVDLQETAVKPQQHAVVEHEECTTDPSATEKNLQEGSRAMNGPGEAAAGKTWASKLSKRPPTPGVGLHQPVSIFASRGDTCTATELCSSNNTCANFSEGVHVQQTAERAMLGTASAAAKQEAWAKKLVASKPATPAAAVGMKHAVQFRRTESEDDEDASVQCTSQQATANMTARVAFTDDMPEAEPVPASRLQEPRQQQQQLAAPKVGVSIKQAPVHIGIEDQVPSARRRASFSTEPAAEASIAESAQQQQQQCHQNGRPRVSFSDELHLVTVHAAAAALHPQQQQQTSRHRVSFGDAQDAEAIVACSGPVPAVIPALAQARHGLESAGEVEPNGLNQQNWQEDLSSQPVLPNVALLEHPVRMFVDNALFDSGNDKLEGTADEAVPQVACGAATVAAAADPPVRTPSIASTLAAAALTKEAAAASPQHEAGSSAVRQADSSSSTSVSTVDEPASMVSLQQALLRQNADLALEKRAQQERKMSKHPTTPGAGLGKRASIFSDDEQGKIATAGSPATASAGPKCAINICVQQALLLHNPDLALEQQTQQERKMSKHPTTPGAGLGKHLNIFKDDDCNEVKSDPLGEQLLLSCGAAPLAAAANASGSQSAGSSGSRTSTSRTSIQSTLMLRNPDLALEQQAQQERKMSKYPTTPGAGLGKPLNMFKDDYADEGQYTAAAAAAAAAAPPEAAAPSVLACSNSSCRSSIQSALLLHNSDLALEQQAQQERKMSKHPTTPGAGLSKHFNIFKDDSDEGEYDNAGLADDTEHPGVHVVLAKLPLHVSPRQQEQQNVASVASSPATVQEAIVRHNPDLALEKQAQQEQKMKKHATTPGAGLGTRFNMFRDDSDDSGDEGCSSTTIGSPVSSPGRPIPAVSPKLPSDSKPSSRNSSRLGARRRPSPLRSTSPDMMTATLASTNRASSSSGSTPAAVLGPRPGSMNPERPCRASTSPVRRSSNAADSDPSPLKRSSSAADPDPSRLSPLGHSSHSNAGAALAGLLSASPMSAGSSVQVYDLASGTSTQQVMQLSVPPSSGHNCSELHSVAASKPAKLGNSRSTSAEAAVIAATAVIDPVAASPHRPHSPSRLSRSTSPADDRGTSRSSSPSLLCRSNSGLTPTAAAGMSPAQTEVEPLTARRQQAAHEISNVVCTAAAGPMRSQGNKNIMISTSSDKLSVRPEMLAPPCAASSPAATYSSSVGSSSLSRASIGGTAGGLSGSNSSSSPLRRASSMNDPLPARGSPLRRDSSCTGTPVSCRSSRRNSTGWE